MRGCLSLMEISINMTILFLEPFPNCMYNQKCIPAEIWSLLKKTAGAESILQVRIHLNFLGELRTLDFYKGGGDSFHVRVDAAESDPATAYRIPVRVSINTSVHNASKQVVEGVGEAFSIHHSVQGAHKYSFLWV